MNFHISKLVSVCTLPLCCLSLTLPVNVFTAFLVNVVGVISEKQATWCMDRRTYKQLKTGPDG
jgi:hypothetical protein